MNNKILLISLLIFSGIANAASEKEMVNDSKLAIKRFSSVLKDTLKNELNKGGVTNAVTACHSGSEAINQQLIAQLGWKISRTSLKVRNPKNTADAWEQQVLHNFEKSKAKGTRIKQLHYSEIIKQGKHSVFRYMQAIPISGNCLSCHGEKIPSPVKAKLQQLYPEDKATGYKVGDIRGAFSITRKIY